MPGSAKIAGIVKILQDARVGGPAARIMEKHKKSYERHSKPRNRVAHSKCLGIWTRDREFVVFAVYEKAGDELLAIEAIPVAEMYRATRWGKAMTLLALKSAEVLPSEP